MLTWKVFAELVTYVMYTYVHVCVNQGCISVCTGNPPSLGPSARRADHSLPQPLHLKAVFTDQKDRKASIRFEFVSNKSNERVKDMPSIVTG